MLNVCFALFRGRYPRQDFLEYQRIDEHFYLALKRCDDYYDYSKFYKNEKQLSHQINALKRKGAKLIQVKINYEIRKCKE